MKKKSSKRIPISAASEIGKKYDKDQVILVTWNKEHGDIWVTTWGKTLTDCSQAAEGGNFVKKALGWPNELTEAKPAREKKLRKKIIGEILDKILKLDKDNYVGLDTVAVRDIRELLTEKE